MTFDQLLETILKSPGSLTIELNGVKKTIRAMVRLTTVHFPNTEYIKIRCNDDSFLLLFPSTQEMYYSDHFSTHIETISDDRIGKDQEITYEGKSFVLDNADDYQVVLEVLFGSPFEIEGECAFSDYVPTDGSREILSLGWITRTGERADIYCKKIDINTIHLMSSEA